MDDRRTADEADRRETTVRETERDREAASEGETAQEHEAGRDAADARPAFGDDKVTPRLNDGR